MAIDYMNKVTTEVYAREAEILKKTNSSTLSEADKKMLDSILGKMQDHGKLTAKEIEFLDNEVHQYIDSKHIDGTPRASDSATGAPAVRDSAARQLLFLERKEGCLGNRERWQERKELFKQQLDILFNNKNSASLSEADKKKLDELKAKLDAGGTLSWEDGRFIRQEANQFREQNKGNSTFSAAVNALREIEKKHEALTDIRHMAKKYGADCAANELFQLIASKKPPVIIEPPLAKPPVTNEPPLAKPPVTNEPAPVS